MKIFKKTSYIIAVGILMVYQANFTYAQTTEKENRLQVTVRGIHSLLEKLSWSEHPPGRYFERDNVLLYDKGKINKIPIDSLKNFNATEYEIRIVYDHTENVPPSQIYQGAVVIYPLSMERKKKFLKSIMELKKKGFL